MQMADELPTRPAVQVVGPSLVADLSWCIHGAGSEDLRRKHPVLDRLYGEHEGLRERVLGIWNDGIRYCAELEVLAHHAGVIDATDFETARKGFESGLATVPLDLELSSETAAVRAAILHRLEQLRTSARLRRRYFDVLGELSCLLAPWWEEEGASAASAAVDSARRSIELGTKWHELVPDECATVTEKLPGIVERSEHGHSVLLVACALFGKGLYVELPGCTLIGFGGIDAVDATRSRTEHLTRPLRALSDPTRLAIFDYLKFRRASVSDIALAFSLSQPTVSVHVKRLREAGLVTAERRGNRMEISAHEATSELLAAELTELLSSFDRSR